MFYIQGFFSESGLFFLGQFYIGEEGARSYLYKCMIF